MASFVRRGRGLLGRRPGVTTDPGETVLQLDDDDSVQLTVIAREPEATAAGGPGLPAGPARPTGPSATPAWWHLHGQQVRLVVLVLVIVLAVATSVIAVRRAQAPTIDQLRRAAGWSDLRTLRVGVTGDVPFLSDCSKAPQCTGFDVEIAKAVAAWLGVRPGDVEFDEVLPEDRERMLGRSFVTSKTVQLDLVVAAFSITRQRTDVDKVVFAGPYLSAQTTVLTRVDHPRVESLAALSTPLEKNGRPVRQKACTPGTTTSAEYLREQTTAEIIPLQRNSECVRRLRSGEVDAAVTDAAIMAGFQATYPNELRMNNIASTDDEHWGIGLGQDFTGTDTKIQARQQLVLLALDDLLTTPGQEGWSKAFEQLPPTEAKPGEDVQVVADSQQPTPWGLRPVRRWPWDRSGTGSGR